MFKIGYRTVKTAIGTGAAVYYTVIRVGIL